MALVVRKVDWVDVLSVRMVCKAMLVLVDRMVMPPLCVAVRGTMAVKPEWGMSGDAALSELHEQLKATYAPYGGGELRT